MRNNICSIFNLAPLYNGPIYKLMDRFLKCDFYIGDRVSSYIELMNYHDLQGFRKRLKYLPIVQKLYWQRGATKLIFCSYEHYIITGDPHCLSTWIILVFSKINKKKTYLWTHGWYGDETVIKKILKRAFFNLSTYVLLYGDFARNLMINEGFNPNKLITIYNSLDYDTQISVRAKLMSTDIYKKYFVNEEPVLLYIGRLQKSKKLELLVEAQSQLHHINIKCNLILIGDTIDNSDIKKLVSGHGLDDYVWFYGPSFKEEILGELIYNADVCVSPGNVGLTAIHCLVYGTPVITHNNYTKQMPEYESVIEGETGGYFKENSVEDLCRVIKSWLYLPSTQRDSIRQNCYSMIDKKYNPNNQIKILKNLLIQEN